MCPTPHAMCSIMAGVHISKLNPKPPLFWSPSFPLKSIISIPVHLFYRSPSFPFEMLCGILNDVLAGFSELSVEDLVEWRCHLSRCWCKFSFVDWRSCGQQHQRGFVLSIICCQFSTSVALALASFAASLALAWLCPQHHLLLVQASMYCLNHFPYVE